MTRCCGDRLVQHLNTPRGPGVWCTLRCHGTPASSAATLVLKTPELGLAALIKDGATWKALVTEAERRVPTRGNFPVTLLIIYLLIEEAGDGS